MNKIIVQMDKTVIGKDNQPVKNMVELVRGLQSSAGRVVLITMQPESKRPDMYQWVLKHLGKAFENVPLYMPNDADDRKEVSIVVDWVNDIKKSKNVVLAAIDGRKDTVKMWDAMGITCLGVN